jgi:YcxB-like protein
LDIERILMNSTVNLSFRYLQSDIVRAMRAHYASRLRLWLDIPMIVVLAALGVYSWRSPGLQWLSIVSIVASAVFALILVAAFAIIPPLLFRRQPKFRDEYSLTFSPDGIHFRTAHIDSQLQWSIYSRALVDATSYVLYYGLGSFTVIPKRVFQSAEQQEAFEQLLAQKVPQIVRKGT